MTNVNQQALNMKFRHPELSPEWTTRKFLFNGPDYEAVEAFTWEIARELAGLGATKLQVKDVIEKLDVECVY